MTQKVCDKNAQDRMQFVFTSGLPAGEIYGIENLENIDAIEKAYGIDTEEITEILSDAGLPFDDITYHEAFLGYGAPGEGWLIDVAKTATYIAGSIVVWYEIGRIAIKIKKELEGYFKERSCEFPSPIMNPFTLTGIAVCRFLRFRRKGIYEVGRIRLILGVDSHNYEHGEVYALPIWRNGYDTMFVIIIDCYGNIHGKVRFHAPTRNPLLRRKRGDICIGW